MRGNAYISKALKMCYAKHKEKHLHYAAEQNQLPEEKFMDQLFARIRALSTCDLADIAGPDCILDHRIQNFTCDCMIVGPALTVSLPRGTCAYVTEGIKSALPGQILVIEGHGDATFANWGDYRSHLAKKKGIAGVIIDGSMRDLNACRQVGLPVFALGVTPRTSTADPGGSLNIPVTCGGVTIHPGDIIIGDDNGVLCLPLRGLEEIVSGAEKKVEAQEKKIAALYE